MKHKCARAIIIGVIVLSQIGGYTNVIKAEEMQIVEENGYDVQDFCTYAYKNAFHDDCDPEILRMLIKAAYNKNKTGSEIIHDIVFSEQAQNNFPEDEDFIRLCYRTVLNRQPLDDELSDWLSYFSSTNCPPSATPAHRGRRPKAGRPSAK